MIENDQYISGDPINLFSKGDLLTAISPLQNCSSGWDNYSSINPANRRAIPVPIQVQTGQSSFNPGSGCQSSFNSGSGWPVQLQSSFRLASPASIQLHVNSPASIQFQVGQSQLQVRPARLQSSSRRGQSNLKSSFRRAIPPQMGQSSFNPASVQLEWFATIC